MSEINLTTRKLTDPNGQPLLDRYGRPKKLPKIIGTFVKERDDETGKPVYHSRFSEAYREEGHDFIKSFKVLKLAYWLKYHLLTPGDISVYEDLQLFSEREIPFTIEVWAEERGYNPAFRKQRGTSPNTLRQHLDNLINAELLEIVRTDGQGAPNFYILRTPYFERESFEGESGADRKWKIKKAGYELPVTFLEDHIDRLQKQIRNNDARRLRAAADRKKLKEHRLVWFRIANEIGMARAADVDNYVWKLAKGNLGQLESTAWKREIRNRLNGCINQLSLRVDKFFIDYLEALFDFYHSRVSVGG